MFNLKMKKRLNSNIDNISKTNKRNIKLFNILKLKNKLIITLAIFSIILFPFSNNISFADDEENENENIIIDSNAELVDEKNNTNINQNLDDNIDKNKINESDAQASNQKDFPIINSRRYVVFDRDSKTDILGKDENKETPMASTTKIMTTIIVLENCKNLNEEVVVDKKATQIGGSKLKIKAGDKITVNDLLYGMMLRSGNDASIALAIYLSESVENFVNQMNEKAQSLKLTHTHFTSPYGLDNPMHYTTPHELALLTDYALQNEIFRKIVGTKLTTIRINGNPVEIKNTNELLCNNIEGVYGVKTGFTNGAGRCLVTAVKRNDMDLIVVTLEADTRKERAKDTINLVNYVTKNYRVENVYDIIQQEFENWKNINLKRIEIEKTRNDLNVELSKFNSKKLITNKEISIEINMPLYFEAPIKKGNKVGTLIVKNGDNITECIDIVASNNVKRNGIVDYFKMYAKILFLQH